MQGPSVPNRHLFSGLITGLLSGVAASGFYFLSDRFGETIFGWIQGKQGPMRLPLVVMVPFLGLFIVGLVMQYYPQSCLGGVREVSEALDKHKAVIPYNRVLNVILSGLVLAFGGSVGPEGPMVQMGALIGSKVGQRFALDPRSLGAMVRAGAAAGIAAAFRSPAGGVLLAVEIFGTGFDSELPVIGIAAVFGYLVRTAVLGVEYPFALHYTPGKPTLPFLLVLAPLMGLLAAPVGHLFILMFARGKKIFPKRWPLSVRVALGGFLVGCMGIYYPQVMSAGYQVVVQGLKGGIEVRLFIILLVLKMVATSVTFGSGAVGGLFAPTLFIGAMFGGALGFGAHALFPVAFPEPEVIVLLGMVVMFGSIVKGYWCGLLLIADMSGCYNAILLPGIIAGGISYLLSWRLYDRSIFDLPLGREQAQGAVSATVQPVMQGEAAVTSEKGEPVEALPQEP